MNVSPTLFRRLINLYPPYIGAGVSVDYVSTDWKELHVSMALRWYNRNAVGTHFGGSLYAMIDPHLMLLLIQLLGRDYLVWDKSASIEFVKASKKKVRSVIKISDDDLETIRRHTENGDKYFAKFLIEITDESGDQVATAEKVTYIRRKDRSDSKST
jgi:acyl-coenzyme A thioesterase PaaI-like protein